MIERRHAGFAGYLLLARVKPAPPRPDGATVLVFDGSLRVLLHPVPGGDLVLETRIADLEADSELAGRTMVRVMSLAAGRGMAAPQSVVLDTGGRNLVLQRRVAADASADEFEDALGNFLDDAAAWLACLAPAFSRSPT
jgi:hypothetical protein